MAGSIIVGKNSHYNPLIDPETEKLMSESMASSYALCFGDTIIDVLEKSFPKIIPEITFVYEFMDTIDFSTLDKKSFNKVVNILKKYFDKYQNTKEDNTGKDIAKHVWLGQVYPYVLKDERYEPE